MTGSEKRKENGLFPMDSLQAHSHRRSTTTIPHLALQVSLTSATATATESSSSSDKNSCPFRHNPRRHQNRKQPPRSSLFQNTTNNMERISMSMSNGLLNIQRKQAQLLTVLSAQQRRQQQMTDTKLVAFQGHINEQIQFVTKETRGELQGTVTKGFWILGQEIEKTVETLDHVKGDMTMHSWGLKIIEEANERRFAEVQKQLKELAGQKERNDRSIIALQNEVKSLKKKKQQDQKRSVGKNTAGKSAKITGPRCDKSKCKWCKKLYALTFIKTHLQICSAATYLGK